jgi:stage V sporulation protein K
LFKELDLLGSGTVVESSGPDLCGSYVGEAKNKILALLNKAVGGVLFIDEAYVLGENR